MIDTMQEFLLEMEKGYSFVRRRYLIRTEETYLLLNWRIRYVKNLTSNFLMHMNPEEFITSVREKKLPASLSIYMQTLWYAGTGNWNKAHELIQDEPGKEAALLHAYLHRVEGDQWNADYWYRNAGEVNPGGSLEEEWKALVIRFL